MKRISFILYSCILVFLNPGYGQEQLERLYGTSTTPLFVDTVNTTGNDTLSISRQINFLGSKAGFISLYGKVRVLSGSDTSFTVWYRELGSVYDTLAIWSQYDSLGAIADGDTTFFFSVATPSSFKESDGIMYKFVMPSGGSRSIEIRAITKIK